MMLTNFSPSQKVTHFFINIGGAISTVGKYVVGRYFFAPQRDHEAGYFFPSSRNFRHFSETLCT